MCERELHLLFRGAAVLQQSDAGIPLIGRAAGQDQLASHVLNELFGPAVVLQAHSLRTVQHEDQIYRPLDTTSHGGL